MLNSFSRICIEAPSLAKLTEEKMMKLSIYFIETLILYKLQHI